MKTLSYAILFCGIVTVVNADGDPERGKREFNKCKSCHMIVSDDGDVIVKGGRTGPNLWGVTDRVAGTADGYRYGKDHLKAAEMGLVWTEDQFSQFVTDPRSFLKAFTGNSKARSKMSFRLKSGAEDVFAYLAQFGPVSTQDEAPIITE